MELLFRDGSRSIAYPTGRSSIYPRGFLSPQASSRSSYSLRLIHSGACSARDRDRESNWRDYISQTSLTGVALIVCSLPASDYEKEQKQTVVKRVKAMARPVSYTHLTQPTTPYV